MKFKELTAEQRGIAVDTAQLYEHSVELQPAQKVASARRAEQVLPRISRRQREGLHGRFDSCANRLFWPALYSIGSGIDLIAEQSRGLEWLTSLPLMTQIVIADNGFPVRFVVPEPRVLALHKLWVSLQPTRDPIKRKRDLHQAEAVVQLALDYFNLKFDDPAIKALPSDLTSMIPGLVERINDRRSKAQSGRPALPPGFEPREDESNDD